MKTIGVLGGLGPQATMDFEARIHRVSQQRIPQHANTGYPPMIVYYCRHAPILLDDDGSPYHPLRPDPRLLDAAKQLGQLVDVLVITSNTPHLFEAEIAQAAGRPLLNMIDLTLQEVQRRRWRRVGVLGLHDPVFYTRPLVQLGIGVEVLNKDERAPLDAAIIALMEGRSGPEATVVARQALQTLRDRAVDGIILGCTEIPLLLNEEANAPDLIDPLQLLTDAALEYALA
ncbi:MAG: aspartate racemase [Herpetosiphonaceae bacterium]|nr:MAG: aspartate racemase [Herpetosiphonaceae bacterium]